MMSKKTTVYLDGRACGVVLNDSLNVDNNRKTLSCTLRPVWGIDHTFWQRILYSGKPVKLSTASPGIGIAYNSAFLTAVTFNMSSGKDYDVWVEFVWGINATCSSGSGMSSCDPDDDDEDDTPPMGITLDDIDIEELERALDELDSCEPVKMKTCPDCKGKKGHLLLYSFAKCKKCNGTGEVPA